MIYLKTIFSQKSEMKYIVAQYAELEPVIDYMIIVEPMFTHTGELRELIGIEELYSKLPTATEKVIYLPLPINASVYTGVSNDEDKCHSNEKYTRGGFVDYFNFKPTDIIISTDADEVLYRNFVVNCINSKYFRYHPFASVCVRLHQFTYKDTWLAKDFIFYGPTICKYSRNASVFGYRNWRYQGRLSKSVGGCHFSWCLSRLELSQKAKSFAHAPSIFGNHEIFEQKLEKDLENRTYSFRTNKLQLTEIQNVNSYWPKTYKQSSKIFEENV